MGKAAFRNRSISRLAIKALAANHPPIPTEKSVTAEIIAYINDRIARSQSDMISENLMVTPKMAQIILDKYNTENRPIHRRDIARYVKAMLAGSWVLTSQGMSFRKSGSLGDGQHRLMAVIESGVTCPIRVTFGEEEAAFDAIDTGAKRSSGDTLALKGYLNATTLGAAIRILHNIANDESKAGITNKEVLETIEAHPGLADAVHHTLRIGKLGGATGAAVAYYLISTQSQYLANDPSLIEDFFTKMAKGENLTARHPVLTIRAQMIRGSLYRTKSNKMHELAASIILCWNAYVQGRTPHTLQWKTTDFPTAV